MTPRNPESRESSQIATVQSKLSNLTPNVISLCVSRNDRPF